jgi:hypothetical protein
MPELPVTTVNVLFTDIEGSTTLREHNPAEMRPDPPLNHQRGRARTLRRTPHRENAGKYGCMLTVAAVRRGRPGAPVDDTVNDGRIGRRRDGEASGARTNLRGALEAAPAPIG